MSKNFDEKFVIGTKNLEPAPPEFLYYCGPKAPIQSLSACIDEAELVWDENPACGEVFRSKDEVAAGLDMLTQLLPRDNLFIRKREVTYTTMETEQFKHLIKTNKVSNILKILDADDIKYLQDNGILDLTIVT